MVMVMVTMVMMMMMTIVSHLPAYVAVINCFENKKLITNLRKEICEVMEWHKIIKWRCVMWQDRDRRLDPRQTARRAPTLVLQYKSAGCGDAERSGWRCIWCGNKEKDKMKRREYMKWINWELKVAVHRKAIRTVHFFGSVADYR